MLLEQQVTELDVSPQSYITHHIYSINENVYLNMTDDD